MCNRDIWIWHPSYRKAGYFADPVVIDGRSQTMLSPVIGPVW